MRACAAGLLLISLLFFPVWAGAQQNAEAENAPAPAVVEKPQVDENLTNMDIKTSTLIELAEWSRELGLGEGGGRAELEARIRQYYGLGPLAPESVQRVVTIEKARSTEYFTLKSVDEEYARLSGGVQLNLKDGETIHKISAWSILFNRTRSVVYATGDVVYVKDSGGSMETSKGEAIVINLDTWVADFINTVSEHAMEGAATAYRFAGEVISQTGSETTVLKQATISNAGSEEPYWSLNATRLWLFPGSDWAVFNAVLKVGEVPVFWLPFFPYPADEVVFHPAIGTRTREGSFVQTTTYLMGRKSVSATTSEGSISKVLGAGEGMERVSEGIFLRTTGKKDPSANDKVLAIMLDAYANLGFYTGVKFVHPGLSVFKAVNISGGMGWTKTVRGSGNFWTPYDTSADWAEDWNHSYLFGAEIPFRYRLNASTNVTGAYGTLELKLPFYSDPFIDYDVMNRSEDFDWISLLMSQNEALVWPPLTTTTLGAYSWSINAKPNFTVTSLAPYLSSVSVSSLSSVLAFISQTKTGATTADVFPDRAFFRPDKFTAYSISAALSGAPVTLGGSTSSSPEETALYPLKEIGEPLPPWADEKSSVAAAVAAVGGNEFSLSPPALSQVWTLPSSNALKFSFQYNLNPSSATEFQFAKKNITKAEDVKWDDYQSILTNFVLNGSTAFTVTEAAHSLFSVSAGFTGAYQWQTHPYMNDDELDQTDKITLYRTDYRGRQWTINSTYGVKISPFYWSDMWKTSGFQWTLTSLVAKSAFDETRFNADWAAALAANSSADPGGIAPQWTEDFMEWKREKISAHTFGANFGASILDKMQDLTFTVNLPPLYQSYSAGVTARVWISETNMTTQIQEDTDENKNAGTVTYHYVSGFIFRPINITETLNFGASKSMRVYGVYDAELNEWSNATASLTLWTFSTAFSARRMRRWYYDDAAGSQGWKQNAADREELQLESWTFSWAPSYKFESLFGGYVSLSFSLNANMSLDLQRYTYSKLSFGLNVTVGITKFLDFTMGMTSENQYMYRYLQDLPIFSEETRNKINPIINNQGAETNFFLDLFDSFRFDDDELRKKSGFKLKSLNFAAVHHLGDWDAKVGATVTPYLDSTSSPPQYKFRTTFSFLVQWVPMSEVKTEVFFENDKFRHTATTLQ
jgi:lipopolysaccharide assembly outer membrane protein LptD (OstA)